MVSGWSVAEHVSKHLAQPAGSTSSRWDKRPLSQNILSVMWLPNPFHKRRLKQHSPHRPVWKTISQHRMNCKPSIPPPRK